MDIYNRYGHEINAINNYLEDLSRGKIYEIDKVPGVPLSSTLAKNLKDRIDELLYKIENDEPGFKETAAKYIK